MRRAANVVDVIALEFLLELRGAPPTDVLPPVVGEQLPRRAVGRHRLAVDLHHVGAGLAAIHPQAGDVPRIVIEEPDDVRRAAQDGEVGDVALPHLVRRGTLEPAGRRLRLLARLRPQRRQPCRLQMLAHRLGTGFQAEQPSQNLRDPLRPLLRVGLLQRGDLRMDRGREFGAPTAGAVFLQPAFPVLPVELRPIVYDGNRDAHFAGHELRADPFFQMELHCAAPYFVGISGAPGPSARLRFHRKTGHGRNRPRTPPGGRSCLLQHSLCFDLLTHR